MSDNQKECQDCGWRGLAAELDQTADESGSQTHIFCPDCGSTDINNFNPDENEVAPES